MSYLVVRHKVTDYDKWRQAYEDHGTAREAAGCQGTQVLRDASDPNEIIAIMEWDNNENAQKFASSPELRDAMQDAGVAGKPDVHFMDDAGRTSK